MGLRFNLGKSTLIGINVEHDHLTGLAEEVDCGVRRLPLTYLGLPNGGNSRSKRSWAPVVEKVEKRLAG